MPFLVQISFIICFSEIKTVIEHLRKHDPLLIYIHLTLLLLVHLSPTSAPALKDESNLFRLSFVRYSKHEMLTVRLLQEKTEHILTSQRTCAGVEEWWQELVFILVLQSGTKTFKR